MRLVSYNIEWFDRLFDDHGRVLADDERSARYKVTRKEQADAIARVLRAMDADGVMVIEAPDTNRQRDGARALETFAEQYNLRTRKAMIGFANETQQEIAFWYDPARISVGHDPLVASNAPRFDNSFVVQLGIDGKEDRVRFSKPPLELVLKTPKGDTLRLIGAHLKSKAPHGAKSHDDVVRQSFANRRKQLAQGVWLRRRIDAVLTAKEHVLVMGDLNDGPGLDAFETVFGRSTVEIILGTGEGALIDPNALRAIHDPLGPRASSARFYMHDEKRFLFALLDYIMVSKALLVRHPKWRIWHPFEDPDCWANLNLREALLTASDHFPVALDIEM